jgi:amino acid transporter
MPASRKLSLAEIAALGIGGMVGGGIFATLGLAIAIAGHAVAIALALGGILALLTGWSYAHLGLAFRDDGGSFTYIKYAFEQTAIAGIAGWLLIDGYVGTLALYAATFGAYGAALFGANWQLPGLASGLGVLVLGMFLAVNLSGAKTSGRVELIIVAIKLSILVVFTAAGMASVDSGHLLPVFNRGAIAPIAASAVIFVAYEGFELIPNAIEEMADPQRDLKRGLLLSIVITMAIYIAVSVVAGGHLSAAEVARDQDYVLAVAARPTFGQIGFALIGLAALLSTASAINATLFGAARLAKTMAQVHALPRLFALRERTRPVPWVALIILTALTVAFLLSADLAIIAAFASATFLIIFAGVNISAYRLRQRIGLSAPAPLVGTVLATASLAILLWHMAQSSSATLFWIVGIYASAILIETVLILWRGPRKHDGHAAAG